MDEQLLKDYVATYLNPQYKGDWNTVNSKFPELANVDKQLLKDYVATYLNPQYNGDWSVVNSKFPELFTQTEEVKKKVTSGPGSAALSAEEDNKKSSTPSIEEGLSEVKFFGQSPFLREIGEYFKSFQSGQSKAAAVDPAMAIMGKTYDEADPEMINRLISSAQKMRNAPVPEVLKDLYKRIEEKGGGWGATFSELRKTPGAIPHWVLDSFVSTIPVTEEGLSYNMLATGLAGGLAGGLPTGGVGAVPGALAGLGMTVETGTAFIEILEQKLEERGLKLNDQGLKTLLSDPDVVSEMRNKALAKGVTVGAFDTAAALVGGKAVTSIKKGVTNARLANVAATGANVGIESTMGGAGEAASLAVTGQEVNPMDVFAEMLGEAGPGSLNVAYNIAKTPSYKINGEKVDASIFEETIKTATPAELIAMQTDVKNDDRLKAILDEKIELGVIEQNISDAVTDPDDRSKIIELEKKRKTLEGKKSQSAKNELKAVDEAITKITDKYISPETVENIPLYTIDGVEMDRNKTISAIEEADSLEALEEIQVSNDEELEKALTAKKDLAIKIQEESSAEIFKIAKSSLSLEYISGKELVSSKNPVENKAKQEQIKEKQKNIIKLINCLQTP